MNDSFDYTPAHDLSSFWEDEPNNLQIPISVEYIQLLKHSATEFNKFINVYNANVIWFKKVAIYLEKAFSDIINSLTTSFNEISNTLDDFIKHDRKNDIYRNYKLILDIIISSYKLYISNLFNRINSFIITITIIEKKLSYMGMLILGGLWIFYHGNLGINLPEKKIDTQTKSKFIKLIETVQFNYIENMYKEIIIHFSRY